MELSMLMKQCLTYGIQIYPYEQDIVFKMYQKYMLPDRELLQLDKDKINWYIHGLYLSGQEMSNDWSKGHDILKEFGFKEESVISGHRKYISLVFNVS